MKWNTLFNELKKFLLYKADIDLRTTKLLLEILFKAISETNYKKFQTEIEYLLEFNNKQIKLINKKEFISHIDSYKHLKGH